jgi:signal transduction histidine kinase
MLVGIVSHDLRNPLQAILSAATMARKTSDPDQRQAMLARVQSSATRKGRMIGQILDHTGARQSGGIELARAPTDLATVASEVELAYPQRRSPWRSQGTRLASGTACGCRRCCRISSSMPCSKPTRLSRWSCASPASRTASRYASATV